MKLSFKSILISIIISTSLYTFLSKKSKEGKSKSIEKYHVDNYVGSESCKTCHEEQYIDWKKSDHYMAMLLPNEESVVANFKDQQFILDGVEYHVYKNKNDYVIDSKDNDTTYHSIVKYTFGYYPLQQFLIETREGEIQVHRLTWDSKKNRWFNQREGEKLRNHDWLHWTGNSMNWTTMCASCHSTNVKKNFNVSSWKYHTTYDEINVGCESCHGPGSVHVETGGKAEYEEISKDNQINTCASCHSRRTAVTHDMNPKSDFYEYFIPHVLTKDFYEPDGQIKEEDYVYSSFLSSKMYLNDVVCTDCHNAHNYTLKFEGNKLCTQCHVSTTYDTPNHTFHELGTDGGACINCHMDGKVYMGNDYRRDHSFRIPRPDQSITYGTSNACVSCHSNETNKWASNQIEMWYGKDRKYHFSDELLPGSMLNESSEDALVSLLERDSINPIIRATAVTYLAQVFTEKGVDTYLDAFLDKEAVVRQAAYETLKNNQFLLPTNSHLFNGVNDSKKSVRVLAYRAMFTSNIPPEFKSSFERVKLEYTDMLNANADFVNGQLQLGDYHQMNNDNTQALVHYKKAIELDDMLLNPYINSSILLAMQGDLPKSKETLLSAIRVIKNNDRLYYYLGLVCAEQNQRKESIDYLEKAVSINSDNADAYYNLILNYKLTEDNKYKPTLDLAKRKFKTNQKIQSL